MGPDADTLKKQASRLKLLNELSTQLQDLLQSESFYQEVINLIQSRFHFFTISIWSVPPDSTGTARLEAQAGAHSAHIKIGYLLRTASNSGAIGIVGQVIRTRSSYLSNDLSADPHYTNASLPVISQSELAVPILKDSRLVAVINVESDQSNAFDPEDVIMLEAVAGQLAVAIANQKLYSESREFGRRLQQAVDEKSEELRKAHARILEQQTEQQLLLKNENKGLKILVQSEARSGFDVIGTSPALQSLVAMVDKIAPTQATVLIQGESGTGKELIARKLHFQSHRSDRPYVVVNCGALQESLLESELFGHEKGSFTGAVAQKIGLCEMAHQGTLFLDEIGELSLPIQAKLLRFLQEGEFYRVGGKHPIHVDVRVVSATNRDLEKEVQGGRFREDLFYRLNTITLRMPPLRKRAEDIPQLIQHFLQDPRRKDPRSPKAAPYKIDPRVLEALQAYSWPGNIRELQNTIERLKILSERNEIRFEDLPPNMKGHTPSEPILAHTPGLRRSNDLPPGQRTLEEVEREHILRTLAAHEGNKTRAAQSLGITIKTLYNKLNRYERAPSELAEG
ncbi:MAG: sigma 54-interacting transcriptional regulator [Oligoflexia bacterium]